MQRKSQGEIGEGGGVPVHKQGKKQREGEGVEHSIIHSKERMSYRIQSHMHTHFFFNFLLSADAFLSTSIQRYISFSLSAAKQYSVCSFGKVRSKVNLLDLFIIRRTSHSWREKQLSDIKHKGEQKQGQT